MDDAKAQAAPDEPSAVPETPEDVAILYSWANMPGAKYRDFSASRREYRAQQRAKVAEQQRQAELEAANKLEAAAQREFQEAERIREESRRSDLAIPGGWDEQTRSRELVRRAEEHALRERQEAQRRQQSAESLRVQVERARNEMLEARKRAEEQSARYAEAATQYDEVPRAGLPSTIPGEISDPYYYTGQVDPAYFASTPGVRTAQAFRTSTERRAYIYPVHPGSEEHDAGSLQAYRGGTNFAPSPLQSFRSVRTSARDALERNQRSEKLREESGPVVEDADYPAGSEYYDGKPPVIPPAETGTNAAERDVLIRPVARTPDTFLPQVDDRKEPVATEATPFAQDADEVPASPPPGVPQADNALDLRKITERAVVLDTLAQTSGMFVQTGEGRTANQGLAEAMERSAAEPDPAHHVPTMASLEYGNQLQARVPESWQGDSADTPRLRMARQLDHIEPQETFPVRGLPAKHPPSWLEPPGPALQIFLPPRMQAAAADRPQTQLAIAPVTSGADIRRAGRALRYNRNLDRGRNQSAIASVFDRRRAAQQSGEQATSASRRPDTLQQSRERVASRWSGLKGLIDTGHDAAQTRLPAELQTPALCVMSLSGGVGRTSIAAGLGRALSAMGEHVLLADTNPYGLLPYYFGGRDLGPGVLRTFTPPESIAGSPLFLVNYASEGLDNDEVEQGRVLGDLAWRARNAQRVIVDLGGGSSWLASRLASQHPWILVPIAPDMNSVVSTRAMERLFTGVVDRNGHPVRPYYVLNQYDSALPLHLDIREALRRSLGERLLRVTLRRSSKMAEALAQGMTVIDYAPSSAIAEDYINLANWLRALSAPGTGSTSSRNWRGR